MSQTTLGLGQVGGFLKSYRYFLALLIVPVVALVLLATVYANDNTTSIHWHAEGTQFRLLTNQLPDAWENPIRNAADEWTDETTVFITESSSSDNTVWRGAIPQEWWGTCPPQTTGACTYYQWADWHLYRSQMVFNWDHSFNTAWVKCFFNIGRDVETFALHEFGHFAGVLDHSTDSDTIMHEDLYGDCQRNLDSHDISSMDTQYGSH